MPVPSSWLTASRMRRLEVVLRAIPDRAPGLAHQDARMRIWRTAGGPLEEIETLVEVLVGGELVRRDAGRLRVTAVGRRLSARNRGEWGRHIALALLRAGLFHDQARRFLETFETDDAGAVVCRLADARRTAPQLTGVLQLWPDARHGPLLRVPESLVAELTTVWALLGPPSGDRLELDRRRKTIGNRAEGYTYQLERMRASNPSLIVWVARDDDRLGYDVEDRARQPRRMIEVKGSGGPEVLFYMSANEWRKAHEHPDQYEIQFWGRIDLNRPTEDEFPALRSGGYPIVFRNLAATLQKGELTAIPDRWKVRAPGQAQSQRDDDAVGGKFQPGSPNSTRAT